MNAAAILAPATGEVAQARRDCDTAQSALDAVLARHQAEKSAATIALSEARVRYDAIAAGLAAADYDMARAILHVWSADGNLAGEDARAIDDVLDDLAATGGDRLRVSYACTKDYDRWHHQHVGWTTIRMGPRHGNVVFSIELREQRRERLSALEVYACMRYLHAVRAGMIAPTAVARSGRAS